MFSVRFSLVGVRFSVRNRVRLMVRVEDYCL